MEQRCCLCSVSFNSPSLKGRGKEKVYNARGCNQERKILEKFTDTLKLCRSLLPTGGKICYSCLTNLRNWNKKMAEVTRIQEELVTCLQQSESTSHRSRRSKRTLSEAETDESTELTVPNDAESLPMLQDETLTTAEETLEPGESSTTNADESFNIDVDVSMLYTMFCVC